jgi:hypothetical protein
MAERNLADLFASTARTHTPPVAASPQAPQAHPEAPRSGIPAIAKSFQGLQGKPTTIWREALWVAGVVSVFALVVFVLFEPPWVMSTEPLSLESPRLSGVAVILSSIVAGAMVAAGFVAWKMLWRPRK